MTKPPLRLIPLEAKVTPDQPEAGVVEEFRAAIDRELARFSHATSLYLRKFFEDFDGQKYHDIVQAFLAMHKGHLKDILKKQLDDFENDSNVNMDYFREIAYKCNENIDYIYSTHSSIISRFIEKKHTSRHRAISVTQRIEILREYAQHHGDESILEYMVTLFPELRDVGKDSSQSLSETDSEHIADKSTDSESKRSSIPSVAPEIYQGLRGPETPPEFVKRAYAPWLGKGLDRVHIKHLDPKLYTAIDNWTRKPGNEWPADVDLPTRGEQNRRMIEQLRKQAPDGDLTKVVGEFTLREAQRIRTAARRNEQKRQ